MANPEHLQILRQGVEAWNQWLGRQDIGIRPDLSEADLSGANLPGADLTRAFLYEANFSGATLNGANFYEANLRRANLSKTELIKTNCPQVNLSGANLSGANLSGANLNGANLSGANLYETGLGGASLRHANLRRANLTRAFLHEAHLSGANLREANLYEAELHEANLVDIDMTGADVSQMYLFSTVFGNTNLTAVQGLETCRHEGPSILDHRTLARSWPLPLAFLRGCGLPDALIDYLPSLLNQPFQFYSCFISYASKDHAFAERLYADLQNKGVRCWFSPEDMKIGDRLRPRIDETIRVYDKLLLVLSKNSVGSTWVEQEVETAIEQESKRGTTVLFPVRMDNTVMT